MCKQWGLRALNGVMSMLRREREPWSLVLGLKIPQISVFPMGTSSQGCRRRQWQEPFGCAWLVGEGGTYLHPGGLYPEAVHGYYSLVACSQRTLLLPWKPRWGRGQLFIPSRGHAGGKSPQEQWRLWLVDCGWSLSSQCSLCF